MVEPLPNTSSKPMLQVLRDGNVWPPPIWLMRQAGRYLPEYRALRTKAANFLDFCYRPDLCVEAALQPLRRYNFDAAILFSDILVIPDAMGQKVAFVENEGPVLTPVRTVREIEMLSGVDMLDRLAPVFEAVTGIKRHLRPEVALIGFAGAPWTLATYMVDGRGGSGFVETKRMMRDDPNLFGRLIGLLVDAIAVYVEAQIDHGAEIVQLFDSWAGALEGGEFQRWVIEPTTELVTRIRSRYPEVPIIGFPRGCGANYLPFVKETGVNAISLDQSVQLDWAIGELWPHAVLQGNLDPAILVAGGAALDHAIDHILRSLEQGPFIFNLGHGIVPETPPENVARLVQRIRSAIRD
jgi:uroporphyrinogen decarboxylase